MRCYLTLLALAGSLLAACSPPSTAVFTESTVLAEEYEVYTALIEAMVIYDQVELVAIIDHTTVDMAGDLSELLEHVLENVSDIAQETLEDFRVKNEQSYPLSDSFDLGVSYVLVSQQEQLEIFRDGGSWNEFYTRYPDSQGIMTISRVGFNREKNQALVYVGNQSDGKAGAGYCVLLTKENGVWTIQEKVMVWVS